MGLMSGMTKFGKGSVFGAAIGAAAAVLFAPGSGRETRNALVERIQRTRKAGVDARAATEQELIDRYRGSVNSAETLTPEKQASEEAKAARLAHIEATKPDL